MRPLEANFLRESVGDVMVCVRYFSGRLGVVETVVEPRNATGKWLSLMQA